MPLLDMSDVLLDPDFMDTSLVCHRQVQTVDEDNFTKNTAQDIPFLIVTQFRLTQGQPGTDISPRLDADIVSYNGRDYRVTFVDPYTRYGAGFVQAHCELVDFNGGTPVE
ncbi:head-tail adaptor [Salmonella enterica]|nr:head-tail adaptor [Salmonella enterica]